MLKMAQQMALAEADLQAQVLQHYDFMHDMESQSQSQPAADPLDSPAVQAELAANEDRALAAAQQIVPPAIALLQLTQSSNSIRRGPQDDQEVGPSEELMHMLWQLHAAGMQQQCGTWEFIALPTGLVSSSSSNSSSSSSHDAHCQCTSPCNNAPCMHPAFATATKNAVPAAMHTQH
jgi:hypothetical protein